MKNKAPSKMIAIRNTTTTARNAWLDLKGARNTDVRLIGDNLLIALTEQTGAMVDRNNAVAERTAEGGKKKLKQSPATISTKLRKALGLASTALKATGTKLAKTVAKDIEAGLARSLELYTERQAFIANR